MIENILKGKNALNLSTEDVESKHSFDYWRDVVCNHMINVDCEKGKRGKDFFGRICVERYADLTLCEVHSQSSVFIRKKEHIQKMSSDFMLLTLRLNTNVQKIVDPKGFNVATGDISMYHGTREYLLKIGGNVEGITYNIPLKTIHKHIMHPEDLHGSVIAGQSGIGRLAANHMLTLASQIGQMSAVTRECVIDNFLQLLAISTEDRKSKGMPAETIKESLALQVKEFILVNLANQELGPEFIADKFRISVRYLYTIFDDENITPCQFILNQRLHHAKAELENKSLCKRSVSEIAFSAGFNNVSHFCRQFKKHFHVTPSELRCM